MTFEVTVFFRFSINYSTYLAAETNHTFNKNLEQTLSKKAYMDYGHSCSPWPMTSFFTPNSWKVNKKTTPLICSKRTKNSGTPKITLNHHKMKISRFRARNIYIKLHLESRINKKWVLQYFEKLASYGKKLHISREFCMNLGSKSVNFIYFWS